MHLIAVAVLLVSLGGCLTSPSPQDVNNSTKNDDDGVSVRPMFLCGEGRAVLAADEAGNLICSAPTLKGLAAKDPAGAEARCDDGQTREWLLVGDTTDPLEMAICHEPDNSTEDSVTLGDPPTRPFACPMGSALKGFSERGEPICARLAGDILDHVALVVEPEDCPWGMLVGTFLHTQFSLPTCVGDDSAAREIKLIGQTVTKWENQNGERCKDNKVVVGFTEDHDLICGPGPTGLKQRPTRYLTTKFDGHAGRPRCREKYHPEPMLLRRVSKEGPPIKVWTCVDSL